MDTQESRDAEPSHAFDWTASGTASTAVVLAVAAADDDDPTAMEPLYDVVDPDALNALFDRPNAPRARVDARFAFEYRGYRVALEATGRGYLYDLDERDGPASTPPLADAEPGEVGR